MSHVLYTCTVREPERSLNVRKYEREKVSKHFPFQVVVVMQPVYAVYEYENAQFFFI